MSAEPHAACTEIELHEGVVVYVPRGIKHRAWGNLKVLVVCIPRGVLHDVHEVEPAGAAAR